MENPIGARGFELHAWLRNTEVFAKIQGHGGGTRGVDNDFALQSFENVGAWIMGRNMFGPVRGPWEGDSWKGWWGGNPPFHTPVFVLTHYARPPLTMEGGTIFHLVTDGLESALAQAKEAANGKDVRIGGGVSVIRQYLMAGQIDEIHFAVSPILLGEGEHLFAGINLPQLGFTPYKIVHGESAMHVLISSKKGSDTIS